MTRRTKRIGFGAVAAVGVAALGAAAVGISTWQRVDGAVGRPAAPPYLTVFMIDGLAPDVFRAELAAGHLPNIETFIDEGTYVRRGIAAFPSMTGYGFYPFLTGVDAARSGVLGLRWFDRSRAEGVFRNYVGGTSAELEGDLHPERPTLFERFGNAHSLAVNSYSARGASRSIDTPLMFATAKYRGRSWLTDALSALPVIGSEFFPDWSGVDRYSVELALADLAHRPKVQWITFASPDGYSHVHGLDSGYTRVLRGVDGAIGRYREEAVRLGLDESRIYAVVSDHGVETADRAIDLRAPLEKIGLRTFRGEATELVRSRMDETLQDFAEYDAVLAINGNLAAYLYVRSEAGWTVRPSLAAMRRLGVVDALLASPAIEHVIARGDGEVVVFRRGGHGVITKADGGYAYRFEGDDPLRYGLDASARSPAEWLEATHEAEYPYAVVRIARLMEAGGAGDLVVTGAPGYDLARDYEMIVGTYRGGHGGLRRTQLVVPLIVAGPGVAHDTVDAMPVEEFGRRMIRRLARGAERPDLSAEGR